jgi:NAD(P)-dependent dehydrogenase (short-subunit alcohol dehydrogenase family)
LRSWYLAAASRHARQEPRIDVLINNAGAMFANRRLTDDGLECTFALNHMRILLSLKGCASAAHQGARLDFDDLQFGQKFRTP